MFFIKHYISDGLMDQNVVPLLMSERQKCSVQKPALCALFQLRAFHQQNNSVLINYSQHLVPLYHLNNKKCQVSMEISVLSCSS